MLITLIFVCGVVWAQSPPLPSPLAWNTWIGQNFPSNGYLAAPESREFALYATAAHDGLNSVIGYKKYTPYVSYVNTTLDTDLCDDWIVAAAYKTLLHINVDTRVNTDASSFHFTPSEKAAYHALIDLRYSQVISALGTNALCANKGVKLGESAAISVWNVRAQDGFNRSVPDPYVPDFQPGQWYPRAGEAQVYPLKAFEKPLAVRTPYHFSVSPPNYNLDNAEYLADLAFVKDKGSNGTTTRTPAESISAIFAVQLAGARYSAAMLTGMYPKLIAGFPGFDLRDFTRLQGLLSLFQADSYICVTNQKTKYQYWRPWQAIRTANDPRWADLYPDFAKLSDPNWIPFQVTPPHSEYPAGHPSASGGFAQIIRRVTGWEVFPGGPITVFAPQPGINETYNSVGEIEEKMVNARAFGGMHLRTSGRVGARLGQRIADYIVNRYLRPK